MTTAAPDESGRCAVIYNPIKVSDGFRERVEEALAVHSYGPALWLETTEEDPGRGMVREAVAAEVDLVIGAGGDGTIRLIADGLANTGIPLGVVPAGTGNLLARNLDLALDEETALEIALTGDTRAIDLIKLSVDDRPAEHFAVIAGVGVDAVIMNETDPELKKVIGAGAYVVAAAKAVKRLPVKVTVRVDGRRPFRRQAMVCLVGNVGKLQGGINLIADADVADGLLNVYVASPQQLSHWLRVLLRMITRRPQKDDRVDQRTGRTVTISIEGQDDYQLDGDVIGKCRFMRAEIAPSALNIRVPLAP
ncbi:MAG TPA: diacylglycerol kinase family protein [Propionibacteriaceae bacterium]|nr:diacylglycerol kinase family protein [Propionibacteriaceae bacterium]